MDKCRWVVLLRQWVYIDGSKNWRACCSVWAFQNFKPNAWCSSGDWEMECFKLNISCSFGIGVLHVKKGRGRLLTCFSVTGETFVPPKPQVDVQFLKQMERKSPLLKLVAGCWVLMSCTHASSCFLHPSLPVSLTHPPSHLIIYFISFHLFGF